MRGLRWTKITMVKEAMGPIAGPAQLSLNNKGGCDLLRWAQLIVMEHNRSLAASDLDGVNAYGEVERECIDATIKANMKPPPSPPPAIFRSHLQACWRGKG